MIRRAALFIIGLAIGGGIFGAIDHLDAEAGRVPAGPTICRTDGIYHPCQTTTTEDHR